jgi:hypothetical protein
MNTNKQWTEFRTNNTLRTTPEFYEQFKTQYNFTLVKEACRVGDKQISGDCVSCNNKYTKSFRAFIHTGPFCTMCRDNKSYKLKDAYPEIYKQISSAPDNVDISTLKISSYIPIIWKCDICCSKCKEPHKYEQTVYSKLHSISECLICSGQAKCNCMNEDEFKCYKCNEIKHISERGYNTTEKTKWARNLCKICSSNQFDDNLVAFLKNLLDTSKKSTKTRNNASKNHEHNITIDYLIKMYEEQEGKCYISGILLNLKTCSQWQCSLERINNDIGYVEGNVCLICIEFQTGLYQWTKNNWNEFCGYYLYCNQNNTTIEEMKLLKDNLDNIFTRKIQDTYIKTIKKDNKIQCKKCKIFFDEKEIIKERSLCKKCNLEHERLKRSTLKGRLRYIFRTMTQTTKQRLKNKSADKCNYEMTLTFEELVELYRNQKGKCYYSNIPLFFSGEYVMSAERLDVFKGYTKDNTVLISVKLNVVDFSVRNIKDGSSGWTKEKLNYAVNLNSNMTPLKITLEDVF